MINTITLVGRMAADPELKYTQSGTAIATFTVAVNRNVKPDEQGNTPCDFIRCTAWRHTAEFVANYLVKGRLVGVEGRLEINQWVDQEGGKHRDAQVQCRDVRALGPKPEERAENQHQERQEMQDRSGNGRHAPEASRTGRHDGRPQFAKTAAGSVEEDYHDPFMDE